MAASLLLALVLIQGPTSAGQVDDNALALALNSEPVLARGIQVRSERAPAQAGLASGGVPVVAAAPCVYYTLIAGAAYCSARAMSNGTIMGLAREDYLLWKLQQEIAKEVEQRMIPVRALAAEKRRIEAQGRAQPAPIRSSAAGTSRVGPGATQGQPRSAEPSSSFTGGMYTPPARSSTSGAKTRTSAPAKRGQLQ
jgi:hypothetical protein